MTTAPAEEYCEVCRFYINRECHRHPPSMWLPTTEYKAVDAETRTIAHWPAVEPTDWCGDFAKGLTAAPQAP